MSYGAFLLASVTLIHELVGPARAATAQGLLTSMSLGFGAITGTLVGGMLLDHIGAVGIFRVAGAGMLVACVTYLFSMRGMRPPQASAQCRQQLHEELKNYSGEHNHCTAVPYPQ
jgi:PPP family 3-phenylpropionic acid transporter